MSKECKPFDIAEMDDLDKIEDFLMNRSDKAVFIPADAYYLANVSMHLLREVRMHRGKDQESKPKASGSSRPLWQRFVLNHTNATIGVIFDMLNSDEMHRIVADAKKLSDKKVEMSDILNASDLDIDAAFSDKPRWIKLLANQYVEECLKEERKDHEGG